MKKIFAAIVLMLCLASGFADENFVLVTHQDPILIYPYAFSTQPKRVIQQVDEAEVLYTFKVLDDSVFRFKVQIFEPDRCSFKNGEPYLSTVGWIDKINTSVYIRATVQDDGKTCIRIYEKPKPDSKFLSIAENDHVDFNAYVDSISGNWYHVVFIYKDELYKGWIDRYCVNPYGCN